MIIRCGSFISTEVGVKIPTALPGCRWPQGYPSRPQASTTPGQGYVHFILAFEAQDRDRNARHQSGRLPSLHQVEVGIRRGTMQLCTS